MTKPFNVENAYISDNTSLKVSSSGRIHKSKDILLPNQRAVIHHLGIDIGGTLAKVTYFSRNQQQTGGKLKFFKIETERIDEFINYLKQLVVSVEIENGVVCIDEAKGMTREYYLTHFKNHSINLYGTGGGSIKYTEKLAQGLGLVLGKHLTNGSSRLNDECIKRTNSVPCFKTKDEMESLIVGLNFLIHNVPNEVFIYDDNINLKIEDERKLQYINFSEDKSDNNSIYPYLLVNIGSGVSMIKVTGPKSHVRIGGSSIGGGTLWGILSLLTNAKTYDDMLAMASNGDNANVDMLVGDIYGVSYDKIGLKSTTIASSFGKVFKTVTGKLDGGYNRNDESVYGSETDETNSRNGKTKNMSTSSSDNEADPESSTEPDPIPSSSDSDILYSNTTNSNLHPQSYHRRRKSRQEEEVEDSFPSLSQFQRLSKFKQSDISKSFLYAVSNNIGQIAYLQAEKYNLKKIFFAGSFIRNHLQTIITLSYAINFWSSGMKKAYFLRHEGYLGSIGAFISAYEDQQFYNDLLVPKYERHELESD